MSRLLIVSCSRRKLPEPGLLPAIARYDGPAFRVLRRFLRQRPAEAPDIYVLSAHFGLIPGSQLIPDYDRRMTPERARELRPTVLARLQEVFGSGCYGELMVWMGRDYTLALDGCTTTIPPGLAARTATGTIGKRLALLRDWLYGESGGPKVKSPTVARRGEVRIRGVVVAAMPEEALDLARRALAEGRAGPGRYQSWYLPVDGWRVAPKWLVAELSGLPVRAFATTEALRVLAQLGIEVRRA